MQRLAAAAILLAASFAWGQQADPVDVSAEPHHHVVLDNLFVKAYDVQVAPKESTLMHRHGKDYLGVFLGNSEIQNTKQGAQPAMAKFKDGDVRYTPGGLVHAIADSGDAPFRNITIELLQPTTNQKNCTESCSIPVKCEGSAPCATATKIMTADQWSVTQIEIPAGGVYPQHTHLANFLVIPLTDADVKVKNQDGPETPAHYATGKVTWNNPLVHTITNTGKTPAKAVVLEFRGRPAGEGSESMGADQKAGEHKPHDHH
jgi:hypothetical protein